MKVLLVEDNVRLRDELRSLITRLGHEVVEAEDGRKAVGQLFGDEDILDTSFNAVITDMRMPNMSGLQLLEFLNERGAILPCLLHSAEEDQEVEKRFGFATFHLKGEVAYITQFLTLANQNNGLR